MEELIEKAKALTWQFEAEHALLEAASGRKVLVRGGRDGISFAWDEPEQKLTMIWNGGPMGVAQILWHTHPRVTGPSDGDLEALRLLNQPESMIYELGGDRDGTRIRPKV